MVQKQGVVLTIDCIGISFLYHHGGVAGNKGLSENTEISEVGHGKSRGSICVLHTPLTNISLAFGDSSSKRINEE